MAKIPYARVQRCIWNKGRFRSLSSDGKVLHMYINTCEHCNAMAFYVLRPGYMMEDLGWDDRERVSKGLDELLGKGLIEYDFDNQIVLDLNHIIKFPPENQKQVIGIINNLNELPKTTLIHTFATLCETLNEDYHKPLRKAIETLSKQGKGEGKGEGTKGTDRPKITKEEIKDSSPSKIQDDLNEVAKKLAQERFPKAYAFIQQKTNLRMHPKAILHSLNRCLIAEPLPDNPWGYCEEILQIENGLYHEQDSIKNHQ